MFVWVFCAGTNVSKPRQWCNVCGEVELKQDEEGETKPHNCTTKWMSSTGLYIAKKRTQLMHNLKILAQLFGPLTLKLLPVIDRDHWFESWQGRVCDNSGSHEGRNCFYRMI